MALPAELRLDVELNAVPRARRFAAEVLTDTTQHQAVDAELVVTELVTNAVLHGQAPIVLRLTHVGELLRVEVEDGGHELPVRPRAGIDSMTGRGLALVGAIAARWGAGPVDGRGKVVWAELRASGRRRDDPGYTPYLQTERLRTAYGDKLGQDARVRVHVGAVPTTLLLEAKAHIDNVVRELTLLRARQGTHPSPVPPAVARLAQAATEDFAEARAAIKRQALDAAERGDLATDLTLYLPVSAADAGERYLDALDEMDRYARSARLLTMAPPAAHRVFRRWYVGAIIDQLRAHSAGKEPPPETLFSQVIADEVNRLAGLEETAERLELLQKVTAELAVAGSEDQIAYIVANNAGRYLGVETARVFVRTERGTLRSLAWYGGPAAEEQARDSYAEFSVDSDLLGAEVARTGEPLFRRSLAEIYATFPQLDPSYYQGERSLHLVPANIGDRNLGLLVLTILGGTIDEDAQHRFVRSLADALAHALDRARALDRASEAAERVAFLADTSLRLSTSLEFADTLDAICDLLVPRFADWCVIHLLREGSLETAAVRHVDPAKTAWARSLRDRYSTPMDAPTGAPAVVRTGRSEVYPFVPPELLANSATDEEHARLISQLGIVSGLVAPLTGRSGVVGSVTLIYAESHRRYSLNDVPFVEDVARRAALALETADMFTQQSGRLASVTRVAEAAQHAILSPPPSRIGAIALAATYVSAAADALVGGDLYEVVEHDQSVRLLIGDVRGKGLAAVRLATVALGEFRAAAADIDDLSQVAQQLDRRVRRYLGEEDFITALVAELHDDGSYAIVSCGHPPALRTVDGALVEIELEPSVPLGLGAQPVPTEGRLNPGDRLVLFTDGVIEARDSERRFVDLMHVMAPIAESPLESALDEVLDTLRSAAGADLDDDIALLVAEYRPG